jgi:hypothetical protein
MKPDDVYGYMFVGTLCLGALIWWFFVCYEASKEE